MVFAGPRRVELRQVTVPVIEAEEILVRTLCSGISVGTERWYLTGQVKGVEKRYPLIPGYQRIGIVEEVGGAVPTHLNPATGCTWAPGPCGWIPPMNCLAAARTLPTPSRTTAAPVLVPEAVTTEEAALATLAAVSQVGMELTPPKLGNLAVVIGQGIVGQMSAQVARLLGAFVITSDLVPMRAALSARYSADVAVNAAEERLEDVVHRHSPEGADLVVDTSGNSQLFAYDVGLLKCPGKLCLQGYFPEPFHVDFHDTHLKRTTVAFPWGFDLDGVRRAFQLLAQKHLTIGPLITHRIESSAAVEAYRLLLECPEEVLGMILDWSSAD